MRGERLGRFRLLGAAVFPYGDGKYPIHRSFGIVRWLKSCAAPVSKLFQRSGSNSGLKEASAEREAQYSPALNGKPGRL
jgi:hypothetical protein